MFSTDDTIVAIATPPGRAGLGVIRISGPEAQAVASRLLTRRTPLRAREATLSHVRDLTAVEALDDGVAAGARSGGTRVEGTRGGERSEGAQSIFCHVQRVERDRVPQLWARCPATSRSLNRRQVARFIRLSR
jgi:hypothetical protein